MLTLRFAKEYRGTARFHTVPVGSREEFNGDNPFIKAVPHLVYLKMVDPTFEDIVYFAKKHKLQKLLFNIPSYFACKHV